MRVYEHADPGSMISRSHPWTDSVGDSAFRYADFRAKPHLIRTALEDFRPWEAHAAVATFYQLLDWLNGIQSIFESNDCAFSGPAENEVAGVPMRLQCSGRLMILFREIPRNTNENAPQALKNNFGHALSLIDQDFEWGAVGLTMVPVRFRELPVAQQQGQQLMISFWAWGDDVPETMANLDRAFENVNKALQHIGIGPAR